MYQTDKARDKAGKSKYYTAPDLDAACAEYFADCDEQGRNPTKPGLLLWLGVTEATWRAWAEGVDGYKRHPAICQKALLEMRDRLEQRKDTAAIFLLKQQDYGGYTDRAELAGQSALHIKVSFGRDKGNSGRNSTK